MDGAETVLEAGEYGFACPLPLHMLRPGRYRVRVSSAIHGVEVLDVVEESLIFDLHDDVGSMQRMGRQGIILPMLPWQVRRLQGVA
jgi:hypothetical protein